MAFNCVIVTPEQQLLDESVRQVIVPAHDGQIGILTGRAPLLVKLGTGTLEVDLAGGGRQAFFVDGGVAQMKGDRLTVLTNEATQATEISVEAARAEYAEAAARQTTDAFSASQRQRQMDRARARERAAAAT